MVLKFDHISYSCANEIKIYEILNSYNKDFEEKELQNIDCKKSLLQYDSKVHNIIMYRPKEYGMPIEITQYPVVKYNNVSISFRENELIWYVRDLEAAYSFFECIDANKIDEAEDILLLQFRPFLDDIPINIKLKKKANINAPGYLDVEGFSSIGIFVDNIQKYTEIYRNKGFFTTSISSIVVDSKKLDIVFSKGKNNEIIELISMSRK